MALITLQEALDFLEIETIEFNITGNNNKLYFKYDAGSATLCTLTNATYDGDAMAAHLQSVLNTALTASLTVSWSSTTYKFTIAQSGHTIQYIHSNSTAGYTIGFTEDSSAAASIASDTAIPDPTSIMSTMYLQVDEMVKEYCHRDFESTSYTEYKNSDGDRIYLDHFPVTKITRVSVSSEDVIRIYNSNTTSYASVSNDGTNVTLNRDGTESTLALGTYTTLETLVAAINALSGWVATISDTSYNDYKSTELLYEYGLSCLDTEDAHLRIRDGNLSSYKVNANAGIIYLPNSYSGEQNIIVDYTAGFSTIPADLKLATLIWLKAIWNKWRENMFELDGYKVADVSKYKIFPIPPEAEKVLGRYRRWLV